LFFASNISISTAVRRLVTKFHGKLSTANSVILK
jgi:hypothetical protein